MDVSNKFMVAVQGDGNVVILGRSTLAFSKSDALNLAAWLVALADPTGDEFEKLLEAVRNT